MMCYKDRTYCGFYLTCCNAETCTRKATPEVRDGAAKHRVPLCLYSETPECYERKTKMENVTVWGQAGCEACIAFGELLESKDIEYEVGEFDDIPRDLAVDAMAAYAHQDDTLPVIQIGDEFHTVEDAREMLKQEGE